jgi:D-beta-D-heptose 7-phosphate kinase/D-beta-D-heptose 1-phosphate adenosyltransferase
MEQLMRVVFTNGCFAAIHAGHVAYLKEARTLGDVLIVAINSTESIRRLKGDRPIIPDADRVAMLSTLADRVIVFDDDTPESLIRAIRPDVLVKGGTTDEIVGREIVESYGGMVVKLPAMPGINTTALLTLPGRTAALP